jgi:phage terminase large subunit GpA-like protein
MTTASKLVAAALIAALTPPESVDPGTWAEQNIVLVAGPAAGELLDLSTTPYWREPMACMAVDAPDNLVWIRKSTQVAFTTMAVAVQGYWIDKAPSTMMAVQPTSQDVKDFNAEQFGPTVQAARKEGRPWASKIATQKSRDGDSSTTLRKKFPGGWLVFVGGHASAGLRRRSIKYMFVDEADELPLDLEQQGDPMNMIEARQDSFIASGDWKRLCGSTPTIDGQSRCDKGFMDGDQRYYNVPCPHCETLHKLDFYKFKYEETWPHRAHYFCESCGAKIENYHLKHMLQPENGARWIPENPGARYKSYHIEAVYSLLTTWDHLVGEYLEAKDDPTRLKTFTNLRLARAFKVQGNAPDADLLALRAEDYPIGTLPAGVLFLTAGVDVQQNRLEWEVVGWGVGKTSWSICRGVIEGDTATPDPWVELGEVYSREFRDWQGNTRKIERMAVDSGYRPQMVYGFTRGRVRAIAIKGVGGHLAPAIGTPSRQEHTADGGRRKGAVMLWPVGVWQLKAEFYGFLNAKPLEIGGYPPGYCHFPRGDLYDITYFQQLTAEQLVETERRGYVELVWVKNPKLRNEALDKRIYATAAAYHVGMGQWTPQYWAQLAAERGAPPEQAQLDLLQAMTSPAKPVTAKHVSAPSAPEANAVRRPRQLGGDSKRKLN